MSLLPVELSLTRLARHRCFASSELTVGPSASQAGDASIGSIRAASHAEPPAAPLRNRNLPLPSTRPGGPGSGVPPPAPSGTPVAQPATVAQGDYERRIVEFLAAAPGRQATLVVLGAACAKPNGVSDTLTAFLQARPHRFAVTPGQRASVCLLTQAGGHGGAYPPVAAAPTSAAGFMQELVAALCAEPSGALTLGQLGQVCHKPTGVAGVDPACPTACSCASFALREDFLILDSCCAVPLLLTQPLRNV